MDPYTITDPYTMFTAPSNKTLMEMTNYAVVLTYDQWKQVVYGSP